MKQNPGLSPHFSVLTQQQIEVMGELSEVELLRTDAVDAASSMKLMMKTVHRYTTFDLAYPSSYCKTEPNMKKFATFYFTVDNNYSQLGFAAVTIPK